MLHLTNTEENQGGYLMTLKGYHVYNVLLISQYLQAHYCADVAAARINLLDMLVHVHILDVKPVMIMTSVSKLGTRRLYPLIIH